jgi:protease II
MGTPQSDDVLLYEETDQLFVVHMSKSDSDRFIFVTVSALLQITTTVYK